MRRLRPLTLLIAAGAVTVLLAACAAASATTSASATSTPLPAHPHLYVIGDSWSAGAFADPGATYMQVAAAALGWSVVVDAGDGTGYETSSPYGADYEQRASKIPASAKADVVLIQGGSNDIGQSMTHFPGAVEKTIALVEKRFPHAHVVLLGSGPDPAPVTAAERTVDADLRRVAAAEHVDFISILGENWVPNSILNDVISPVNGHPTTVGHAYMGGRLAADLKTLAAGWAK